MKTFILKTTQCCLTLLRTENYFLYSHTFTLPKCQSKYLDHLPMQWKPIVPFFLNPYPFLSAVRPDAIYLLFTCWVHVSELLTVDFEEFSFLSSPAYSLLVPTPCIQVHSSNNCCNAWVDLQNLETLLTLCIYPKKIRKNCMDDKNLSSFTRLRKMAA